MSTDRAMTHAASHNRALRTWLKSAAFELRVAGPYDSRKEAMKVEAALISAITPQFNIHPGNGPEVPSAWCAERTLGSSWAGSAIRE
jgi:hypothetical protein